MPAAALSLIDDSEPQKLDQRIVEDNQSGRIPGIGWGINVGINLRFGGFVWDPDIALRQDEEFYERVERDAVAAHAMLEMRTLVAGSGYSIHSRHEKYDPLIPYFEAFYDNIQGFQSSKQLLCYAIIRGTHAAKIVAEVRHDYQLIPDDEPRSWWVVDSLIDRDKRGLKIVWEPINDREPDSEMNRVYHYAVLDPINQRWYRLRREDYIIWAFQQTQTSSLFGHGLANAAYMPVYIANQLEDIQLQAYDAYATGIKKIKVDMTRGEAPQDSSDEGTHATPWDRADDYVTQASEMSDRGHTFVVSSWGLQGGDDMDIMWSQPGMFESLGAAIKNKHNIIQITFLGSAVVGESGGEGSRARAETQSRAGDRRIQSYRAEEDEVYNQQLGQRFWEQNSHNWKAMGLWTQRCPVYLKTARWIDYDPQEEIENINTLVASIGLPVSEELVRDRTGYTAPKPGEKVLQPPPVPGQTAPSVDGSGAQSAQQAMAPPTEANSMPVAEGTISPKVNDGEISYEAYQRFVNAYRQYDDDVDSRAGVGVVSPPPATATEQTPATPAPLPAQQQQPSKTATPPPATPTEPLVPTQAPVVSPQQSSSPAPASAQQQQQPAPVQPAPASSAPANTANDDPFPGLGDSTLLRKVGIATDEMGSKEFGPADVRRDIKFAQDDMGLQFVRAIGEGKNLGRVYVGHDKDGKKWIYKPAEGTVIGKHGHEVRENIDLGLSEAEREHTTYELSKALGLPDLVPQVVKTKNGHAMAFVEGESAYKVQPTMGIRPKLAYAQDAYKIGLLDYVTGNDDRHFGNLFISIDGKRAWAIDNGLSWPTENDLVNYRSGIFDGNYSGPKSYPVKLKDIKKSTRAAFANLDKSTLFDIMARGGITGKKEYETAGERLDIIHALLQQPGNTVVRDYMRVALGSRY